MLQSVEIMLVDFLECGYANTQKKPITALYTQHTTASTLWNVHHNSNIPPQLYLTLHRLQQQNIYIHIERTVDGKVEEMLVLRSLRAAHVSYFTLLLLLSLWIITEAERADKFLSVVQGLSPHIFISVLVTNSRYALPNFFGYLEELDYPKDRISVW